MKFNLARDKQIKLLNDLIKEPSIFSGGYDNDKIIDLLDHVFDLRSRPSEDSRFKDAYEDAIQHLINNDDWDLEYTFLTRFNITEEGKLTRLILYLVAPDFQSSEQQRIELVDKINRHLNGEGFNLETSDFNDNDQPVFTLSHFDPEKNYPAGVIKNQIDFYPNYNLQDITKFVPEKKGVFILNFAAYHWNDYSLKSRCDLVYRDKKGELIVLGEIKVITNDSDNYTDHTDENGDFQNFHTILPDSFKELDQSYCSLGQTRQLYHNLKNHFQRRYRSILYALRDAAFFPDISDLFEKDPYFKDSLIRTNEAERILREIKHELSGRNRSDMYRFTYLFTPKLGKSNIPPVPISFNFEDVSDIPNRICAIIGKNGVGKTQFISQIPRSLAEEDNERFDGPIPLFSKLIGLSYSPFDTFKPSKSGVNVDYIFCSLRNEEGDVGDNRGRAIKFGKTRRRIEELQRVEDWYRILEQFLPETYMEEIFATDESGTLHQVNIERLNSARKELSSGQRMLLESVTNIIAHIRYDSLLLFDEPETHLHPNAIAQLMNVIYELVTRFKSFCVLTTHSPIIVRELLSRNVYVFDRIEDTLAVRKIGIECFGANLSDITEDVFGTNEIPKHYQRIIRRLHREEKTAEEIIEAIQSDGVPISLGLRLFVKSLYTEEK